MEKSWISRLDSIPVGLYEKALPKTLSWNERLNLTRSTGFDFLEMSIDDTDERLERLNWDRQKRKDLKSLVEGTGIKIQSLSLSAHRRFPLGNNSQETTERALDIFKKTIDLAVELGIRYILVGGAEDYYQEVDQSTLDRFLENLGKGFEWASAAGIMLALENWDIQINTILFKQINQFRCCIFCFNMCHYQAAALRFTLSHVAESGKYRDFIGQSFCHGISFN